MEVKEIARRVGVSEDIVAQYLKKEGMTPSMVSEGMLGEIRQDLNPQSAIAPVSSKSFKPAPRQPESTIETPTQEVPTSAKPGQAKSAISEVVTRRDGAVAKLLDKAQAVADRETEKRYDKLAEELGMQMAESEIKAVTEVADFLKSTLGNSNWLLEGARETIDAEIIS